jgi:CHAT domain-containing protein
MQENLVAGDFLKQSILALGKRNDMQAQRFTLRAELSLSMRAGNQTEALKQMDSLIGLARKSCEINFPILSEKEKGEYLEIYRSEVNNYANLSLELQSTHPEMAGKLFNLVLNTKGFLLRAGNQIRTIAQNSGDEELEKIYREWITTTEALAASAASGEDGKLLREKAEEIERKMSEKSSAIRDIYTWENTRWEDIKAHLQKDEAAIEFTSLTRSNAKGFDPQQKEMLLALIIRKDLEQPLMIEIKGMEQMEEAILKAGSSNAQALDQLYALQDWKNNPIRKHLWLPLEIHLKKCKRIYVSPDGILHRIALSAIPVNAKKRWCDLMEIRMVNSTANLLVDHTYRIHSDDKAILFGGIDFNSADSVSKTWDYLPGTKQEVEAIAGLFQKHKLSYQLQQGKNASEEFLKKEATPATILHLSTHGYFFPSPQDAAKQQRKKTETDSNLLFRSKRDGFGMWQFVYSDDPMMRSGLALAGANQVWEKNILAQKEDGVFTALEASAMDLRNTKLLVLSACETGLGDVNATEGVYGLQRAFKMAGVKFMIISLWQVPDKETKIFMETFYGYFLSGIEIHTAFRKTQLDMSKLYSPYQWAAFELVE